jgi:hypothetical protein
MQITKKSLNRQFWRIKEKDRKFTRSLIAKGINRHATEISLCFTHGAYLDTFGIEIKEFMDKKEKELKGERK